MTRFYCKCCGCEISIQDDDDIRICEDCTRCDSGEGWCDQLRGPANYMPEPDSKGESK
jgi:hypothetical protein